MIPPTSIDGTDITGATIDGTDVTEITVDGNTVFTAGPSNLPVAYSNLVAWYPFDSAEYGGSDADDVTAIIGGSGDDTAYDGTVTGATYQSSGGVTDINAGGNSGAFDFDGTNDRIRNMGLPEYDDSDEYTVCGWVNFDNNDSSREEIILLHNVAITLVTYDNSANDGLYVRADPNTNYFGIDNVSDNEWYHVAWTHSSTQTLTAYVDGVNRGSTTQTFLSSGRDDYMGFNTSQRPFNGQLDDWRSYDTVLTNSQINDIIANTEP